MLFVCIMVGGFLAIRGCFPLILSRYQIDYGEGLMLEGALRIRHSQPLYSNPFAFPVVLHVYGPVAYAAAALVLPGGAASFPAGRLLALFCSVSVALLLGVALRRLTGCRWISLCFGLLLLTLPAFRFWLYLFRADVIGLVFSLIGITLYLSNENHWYWSAPFFGLALFCKYSLLAAPVAVLVHLILKRKVRQGFAYAAILVGICALTFMAFQLQTGGWFAFHMFSTHPDRYSPVQFLALAAMVGASAPVVTGLAIWSAVLDFRSDARSFPPVYLVVSALSALTAGKLGSTTNHFLECMVACCMCASLGYLLLLTKHPSRVVPVSMMLSVSVLVGVIAQNQARLQPARELAGCSDAYQYVHRSPSSRVLSENLGPLLAAPKPILISDPFVYGQFVRHHRWPDRRIEDLVDGRYFGLIVLSFDPSEAELPGSDAVPQGIVNAIRRNYHPVGRFACRSAGVMLEPAAASADR